MEHWTHHTVTVNELHLETITIANELRTLNLKQFQLKIPGRLPSKKITELKKICHGFFRRIVNSFSVVFSV